MERDKRECAEAKQAKSHCSSPPGEQQAREKTRKTVLEKRDCSLSLSTGTGTGGLTGNGEKPHLSLSDPEGSAGGGGCSSRETAYCLTLGDAEDLRAGNNEKSLVGRQLGRSHESRQASCGPAAKYRLLEVQLREKHRVFPNF